MLLNEVIKVNIYYTRFNYNNIFSIKILFPSAFLKFITNFTPNTDKSD